LQVVAVEDTAEAVEAEQVAIDVQYRENHLAVVLVQKALLLLLLQPTTQ
jgi:hypothetical protein